MAGFFGTGQMIEIKTFSFVSAAGDVVHYTCPAKRYAEVEVQRNTAGATKLRYRQQTFVTDIEIKEVGSAEGAAENVRFTLSATEELVTTTASIECVFIIKEFDIPND